MTGSWDNRARMTHHVLVGSAGRVSGIPGNHTPPPQACGSLSEKEEVGSEHLLLQVWQCCPELPPVSSTPPHLRMPMAGTTGSSGHNWPPKTS